MKTNNQVYVCLPAGLVDLFTDSAALAAGLNVQWVVKLLAEPLDKSASLAQWRDQFYALKARGAKS